ACNNHENDYSHLEDHHEVGRLLTLLDADVCKPCNQRHDDECWEVEEYSSVTNPWSGFIRIHCKTITLESRRIGDGSRGKSSSSLIVRTQRSLRIHQHPVRKVNVKEIY